MSGFSLANGRPTGSDFLRCRMFDLEAYDITASQLTVDGEIEHRQVSNATFDLEPGSN
ncbi:MAG TPA: hypothetical protein VI251_07185 [Pseudolabrys sp.]|jgi:hypothetical protein